MAENENALAIKYNREYLVVQANELVRSKQDDLSLLEAKLVRLAISQVLENDTDFRTYSCNVVDLAKFLGISKDNIYRDIQDLSVNIMKKSIFIKEKQPNKKGKQNYKIFHWVDYVEYKDGTITFRLSESLRPYLIGLEELFTMYSYEALIDLPTNYSIRLYELLASWQNSTIRNVPKTNYTNIPIEKNEFIFTIGYLREYFNCVDKYPNAGDFIINVIDKAVKAIQKNTLMKVSYRKVKNGRSIEYIVFKLNDWGEPTPEWKEKMKRIEAIIHRSYGEESEDF
jgi:plasmid replication initiation protein